MHATEVRLSERMHCRKIEKLVILEQTIPFPSEFRRNECQLRLNKIETRQRATQLCQKRESILHERNSFPP